MGYGEGEVLSKVYIVLIQFYRYVEWGVGVEEGRELEGGRRGGGVEGLERV